MAMALSRASMASQRSLRSLRSLRSGLPGALSIRSASVLCPRLLSPISTQGVRSLSSSGSSSGSSPSSTPPPPGEFVRKGDMVEVDLLIRDPSESANGGVLVDTSVEGSPVSFVVGMGQVIVGLEQRVLGMRLGESWKATLGPDEAFGHISQDLVVKIPLRKDEDGRIVETVPEIDHVVRLSNGAVGTVVSVTDDFVEIDTNHKMAGKDIEVELKLREIKDQLEEAWSGVRVETVTEGDKMNYPRNGDMVHVHYTCQLASTGKIVDSSEATGRPLSFQIGTGRVIPGWDQGLLRVSLGERARLYVASEFAYGSKGAGGGVIPPNENLVFDIELIGINTLRPPSP